MLFAKAVTGIWLVQFEIPPLILWIFKVPLSLSIKSCWTSTRKGTRSKTSGVQNGQEICSPSQSSRSANDNSTLLNTSVKNDNSTHPATIPDSAASKPMSKKIPKPLSLYPAAMLGTAMTARGEIGFLIASLAETTGLFASSEDNSSQSSKIYLVVTWAIVLCTIIGPLSVGTLVKRVRRLQADRQRNPAKQDPLGVWGVD